MKCFRCGERAPEVQITMTADNKSSVWAVCKECAKEIEACIINTGEEAQDEEAGEDNDRPDMG